MRASLRITLKTIAVAAAIIAVVLVLAQDQDTLRVRTSLAAGADGVIVPERRAAGLTETVARASAGALEHLLVARVPNLVRAMEELKEAGLWLIGLDERAPQNYTRVTRRDGTRVFAYGRDPYFPGWSDTLQLDYSNASTQDAMLAELLGLRFPGRDVHEIRHLARRWGRWLVTDAGLLQEPWPGRVGFGHAALMERLAGRSDPGAGSGPPGSSTPPAPPGA